MRNVLPVSDANDPLFINRLHRAVQDAAAGDPVAQACQGATALETMRALVTHFQAYADPPEEPDSE